MLNIVDSQQPKKHKMVVVDDEIDIANFISSVAEKDGFEVASLKCPSDFKKLYSNDTNIVVTDLHMPGTDGIELIRFLAEQSGQTSLIIISGKDKTILNTARDLATTYGINVLGVLQKPIRLIELRNLLSKYFRNNPQEEAISHFSISGEELGSAIANQDLSLACQPQINMQSGKLSGVETLVRWDHLTKGYVPPQQFVTLAESEMLIHELTNYVFTESLRQAGKWVKSGLDVRVSINVSPLNLTDMELPEKIHSMADEYGIDPSYVVVEITETALAVNMAKYLDILTRLRMRGFILSIDDFGTGYSSMSQLIRAPFNELKVDRSFVKNIADNKDNQAVVCNSISMAHDLGMRVVAEGIESESDWNFLLEQGCDEAQGYWLARPMPIDELLNWIQTQQERVA